jgi:hypothetical protein
MKKSPPETRVPPGCQSADDGQTKVAYLAGWNNDPSESWFARHLIDKSSDCRRARLATVPKAACEKQCSTQEDGAPSNDDQESCFPSQLLCNFCSQKAGDTVSNNTQPFSVTFLAFGAQKQTYRHYSHHILESSRRALGVGSPNTESFFFLLIPTEACDIVERTRLRIVRLIFVGLFNGYWCSQTSMPNYLKGYCSHTVNLSIYIRHAHSLALRWGWHRSHQDIVERITCMPIGQPNRK